MKRSICLLVVFVLLGIHHTGYSQSSSSLYFCTVYDADCGEVGISNIFSFPSFGGYLTVMLDLRPVNKVVGSGKVEIVITKFVGDREEIVEIFPFDVQADWDYIHFDQITFTESGFYNVTLTHLDGTKVASGQVMVELKN